MSTDISADMSARLFFDCQSKPIHLHTAVNIQHGGWRRNCCCLCVGDVLLQQSRFARATKKEKT